VNVVKEVPYTLTATQGNESASVSGNVALGAPDPQHFVAYEAITEQNAIDWCSAALDVAALQVGLASRLAAPAPGVELVSLPPPFGD
jgi:hypothetical protein